MFKPETKELASSYDKYYYSHGCGINYERNEHWLNFFYNIASKVVKDINCRSILDAGCAMGFLVEGFRNLGVEAWGIDISEYAISQVHENIKDYCTVGSISEDLSRKYDLIICIEVIEHLSPLEAEQAIENFCKHTNDIIFSSTPFDYKEATHFNVQPPEYWVELFAQYGFFRDVDFDGSFITPWTIRFRKRKEPLKRIVREYERKFWLLWQENVETRRLLLEMRNQISTNEEYISFITEKEQAVNLQLQHTQVQLQQAQEEGEKTQAQLQQAQEGWEKTQAQLQQAQEGWEKTQAQLQQAQEGWKQAQNIITAMETSKFWKLRQAWFELKQAIGLKTN